MPLPTLEIAALVVPALFLADPVVRQTLQPFESAASLPAVERKPPIVLVIFDELPLNSLLAADGTIDAGRYPNFATFARDAYWFRNTSTVASNTSHAVPAILSGRYPTTVNDVPTIEYYPVNLFTALAPHYEISASFRFRTLCPRRACLEAGVADTVGSLLADPGVVWLHIVLPDTLASTLPPVTEDWGEFARDDAPQSRDIRNDREGLFAQFVSSIDGRPARVHFIHSMLPHMAFEYVPSGRRYHRPDYESLIFRRSRLFERSSPAYADSLHQRHLAQVGFVDHLVGSLVARLREVGAYDEALVIITADHGASYRGGRSRSATSPTSFACRCSSNYQGSGAAKWSTRLSRRSISSPRSCTSLAPLRHFTSTDAHSPTTGFRSERHGRSSGGNRQNVAVRTVDDMSTQLAESLERKERRFGRGDPAGLYAPPNARRLLGAHRSALHTASDVRVSIRSRAQFQDVNLAADPLPLYVAGLLDTSRGEPVAVAVLVNGVVAAVTHSYRERGAHRFGTLIPESSLRNGRNVVAGVALDEPPAR